MEEQNRYDELYDKFVKCKSQIDNEQNYDIIRKFVDMVKGSSQTKKRQTIEEQVKNIQDNIDSILEYIQQWFDKKN